MQEENKGNIKSILEALLFVASRPLPTSMPRSRFSACRRIVPPWSETTSSTMSKGLGPLA